MKDLTIPVPNDGNTDRVEVLVKVGSKKIQFNYYSGKRKNGGIVKFKLKLNQCLRIIF